MEEGGQVGRRNMWIRPGERRVEEMRWNPDTRGWDPTEHVPRPPASPPTRTRLGLASTRIGNAVLGLGNRVVGQAYGH